jgi:serine/threonine protein phosphatase PrpC
MTKDDKFIIMGCDGIWERFSNEEITDFINDRLNKD